jgi:hypothetical protein
LRAAAQCGRDANHGLNALFLQGAINNLALGAGLFIASGFRSTRAPDCLTTRAHDGWFVLVFLTDRRTYRNALRAFSSTLAVKRALSMTTRS